MAKDTDVLMLAGSLFHNAGAAVANALFPHRRLPQHIQHTKHVYAELAVVQLTHYLRNQQSSIIQIPLLSIGGIRTFRL